MDMQGTKLSPKSFTSVVRKALVHVISLELFFMAYAGYAGYTECQLD